MCFATWMHVCCCRGFGDWYPIHKIRIWIKLQSPSGFSASTCISCFSFLFYVILGTWCGLIDVASTSVRRHFYFICMLEKPKKYMYKDFFQSESPVKRWSTDLAVPGSSPTWGDDLPNRKQGSFAHSPSLSPAHHPNMTELLLKRTQNFKLFIHPSIPDWASQITKHRRPRLKFVCTFSKRLNLDRFFSLEIF